MSSYVKFWRDLTVCDLIKAIINVWERASPDGKYLVPENEI